MRLFYRLPLKYKQMLALWVCLCTALILGACGLAAFELMIPPPPAARSTQTEIGLLAIGVAVFLFVAAFIAAVGLSTWLHRHIAGPVLEIVHTARAVARDKNYALRVPVNGHDELGELIENFNEMLGQVQAQDLALHEAQLKLQARVAERTEKLSGERLERHRAEVMLHHQAERISLVNQITRAVAERADLASVFHVLLGHLEDRLAVDFATACTFAPERAEFIVASHGPKSAGLAAAAGERIGEPLPTEKSFLAASESGEIFHLLDCGASPSCALTRLLAKAGVICALAVPLHAEGKLLGVIIVGRCTNQDFTIGDANFLQTLGEHVALAARQAQLYVELQTAYKELHAAQQ